MYIIVLLSRWGRQEFPFVGYSPGDLEDGLGWESPQWGPEAKPRYGSPKS